VGRTVKREREHSFLRSPVVPTAVGEIFRLKESRRPVKKKGEAKRRRKSGFWSPDMLANLRSGKSARRTRLEDKKKEKGQPEGKKRVRQEGTKGRLVGGIKKVCGSESCGIRP